MDRKKIVVGLSGGVDSAVAALLLKEEGHEVTGIFMKNWEEDDGEEGCGAEDDAREARLVAETIGIPFYSFNFVEEYRERVFKRFLKEYEEGFTPNPDVFCNSEIKFKAFLERALELDVDCIATGHYVRLRREKHGYQLLKGVDPGKDQSYFLHALGQEALSKAVFPLGSYYKSEVREIARQKGLPNWDRKDSVGICFIGQRKFKAFLKGYLGHKPGRICDPDGRVIGRHDGLMYHTIGQRQGLGIGGPGEPWFVVDKDVKRRRLIAVQGRHHPLLYASALSFSGLTTIDGKPFTEPLRCHAKIRYRQDDQTCVVYPKPKRGMVVFDKPQRAITPKQSVVFYDGPVCLGGAIIEEALRDLSASGTGA